METSINRKSKINSKDIKRNSKNLPKLEMKDRTVSKCKHHVVWSPDSRMQVSEKKRAMIKSFKTQATQGPIEINQNSALHSEISNIKEEFMKKT